MKRKVIQIGNSTQLISLPRKWALSHNIKKGDELSITELGNGLNISAEDNPVVETREVDLSKYQLMGARVMHALYRLGIDEVKLKLSPDEQTNIHDILSNETVGYEVVEQGQNHCVVKNVSGNIEGFDSLLRRTFLLLVSMAEEGNTALENENYANFKNLYRLEESNNRFTTICRRHLNKVGAENYSKVGPIYVIVESLEDIADQYKYLYQYIYDNKSKIKISKDALGLLKDTAKMVKTYYEVFYKLDPEKVATIGEIRKKLVKKWHDMHGKKSSKDDLIVAHHAVVISQRIFNLVGPELVLAL